MSEYVSDLSALAALDKQNLFSLASDVSHLTAPGRRLLLGPPKVAGPARRGWGEGPDWMVPEVLANTRGPFWTHLKGFLRRLIEKRTVRLDCAGGAGRVFGLVMRSAHRKTGIMRNPLTGEDHISIRLLAKLAKTSLSVTNRVRRALAREGYIVFTKNLREEYAPGKWRSLGPSIRRLSWDRVFVGMPATLRALFDGWNTKADAKATRLEAERIERESAMRRATLEAARTSAAAKRRPLPPQQAVPAHDPAARWRHVEEIDAEHPEWTDQQKFEELRRRAAAPPTRGPSEPQTSDEPAPKS